MPFRERQYTVEDPGGHQWTFSQSIADVAPEDRGATVGNSSAAPNPWTVGGIDENVQS